jgi:hypothetical protein
VKWRRLWKWLGLAGLAGVAATGVVIARDQRQRSQLSPDDVRARLHQRLMGGRQVGGRPETGHAENES